MEPADSRFSELVDLVKSWFPRRAEQANAVSRDFWMPDHSCRVCYECDSQFTIFNRRHHCRLCGRVFCAKCTANFVPTPSDSPRKSREEGDRIRVCNYCFKQCEQDVAVADVNGYQVSSPGLSPSFSATSLASTKSSATANSNSVSVVSYSTGPYQCIACSGDLSPGRSLQVEPCPEREDMPTQERKMDGQRDPSNQFEFCLHRSDDEDECCAYNSDSEVQQFHQSGDYYGQVEFKDVDHGYRSPKVHPAEESNEHSDLSSPHNEHIESHASAEVSKMEDETRPDNDCDASSSIYNLDATDDEPVDFENNGILWLPPEPEDVEDEREGFPFDEDEEEYASGDWGCLRSSNSFGSGESRTRDRANEEHRKAMKHVVDGHFRALVSQLLQVENLPMGEENDRDSWLEVITALSWEAATLLKPDTSKGDGMDPGGYLKVKCIACGRRSESMVVRGIVCKKNVAHRRMTTRIEKPHLLILGGALEYQRKANSLSSVDTLLQQEMDHLKMAVAKIDAQHPSVLLVERSVSRYAQDYLLAKGISLVLNVKRSLLERIARCTGAQIVPSIDNLSSQVLGYCDLFHIEKLLEEHGSAGQGGKKMVKTLMFFEGCPKPLGCTVLVKGANGDELKKVKHVVQYSVFAAYHLALETSFLADEGASLPELALKSPIAVAFPDIPSNMERSISSIPGFTVPAAANAKLSANFQWVNKISDFDPSSWLHDSRKMEMTEPSFSTESHLQNAESPSPFRSATVDPKSCLLEKSFHKEHDGVTEISVPNPWTLSKEVQDASSFAPCASEEGDKAVFVGNMSPRDKNILNNQVVPVNYPKNSESLGRSYSAVNVTMDEGKSFGFSHSAILHGDESYLHDQVQLKEEFPPSPSDHQSILVSLSTRCVWKGTVCERALFRIKYYGSFDKPLGRFLRDHLFDEGFRCRSCNAPSEAHVHCYTHRQGSLTISVKKNSDFPLPGERDGKIWMWHRCLRCPRVNKTPPATRRVVMSDAAWGLSFGKFLELSFSNHAAASRVASCGHSLHRDCLRFYGFGQMVACFRYASIDVHSVYLPPPKLDFNYTHQDWIQKELDEVADQAEHLFSEVLSALRGIAEKRQTANLVTSNVKLVESKDWIVDFEGDLQKEKAQFEESLQKVTKKEVKKGKPAIDILEINKLRRQLIFQAYVWDKRLICSANLGKHSLEGQGLRNNKEKLDSTDKLVDLNSAPEPQRRVPSIDSLPLDAKAEEPLKVTMNPVNSQEGSHELPMDMGAIEEKLSQSYVPSMNIVQQLDNPASDAVAHVAPSEEQCPTVADISDTLDAKWTGENGTAVSENGTSESSVVCEGATGTSDSEEHSDGQGVADTAHSVSSPPPTKGDESVDNDLSWIRMPFQSLYQSFNKISSGNISRFDALHEYNPLYISSFCELERSSGARLLLPLGVNDTVIPVYDDEPTSIISYALISSDYHSQMCDVEEKIRDSGEASISFPSYDSGSFHPFPSFDEISSESFRNMNSIDESILSISGSRGGLTLDPLLYTKALHVRVSFSDDGGKVKYTVTCYYAKSFDALRRTCCPSELDFVRSLSRCKKWGAQGGKSNVFFAKSLDDRFIIKQVTKTELESFIKFAPEYFKYLSESISTGSPTCLAKILGIYQVST
ncbi:hypothetical protein Taro_025686 [Colocasia esculenta]|uniref:1-phosphatidylinositol-3-phosphate 5-kinase n=1 Tax=Colocasia esculenta TaxID=4460 RepID=A0A843VCY9_COLES|nr:hypothetical protein [Colocasia esculenta]